MGLTLEADIKAAEPGMCGVCELSLTVHQTARSFSVNGKQARGKKKIPLHFDLICFGLLLWCDRATHHSLFAHFHTSPVSSDSKLVYFHYLHIELYLIWL